LEKILIVEDSKVISSYLNRKIHANIDIDCDTKIISSFKDLKELFKVDKNFDIALVDINLSDVSDLSLIDFLLENHIPSIVMTANFDEKLYMQLKNKKIIDFVLKDSMASLEYIVTLTARILHNKHKTVLVVDDSKTSLNHIRNFLERHLYKVALEDDPKKALDTISSQNISLVVVDYYMPNMKGTDLIQEIRKYHSKDEVEIIGISSDEKSAIHFLKYGANDFIRKPFEIEEFLHRVNNLSQQLDNIEYLKNIVNTDFLTKIYNRKYFFEEGKKYFDKSKNEHSTFCVAMIDIDDFKRVNDTFGHDVGDIAIKTIANILKEKTKGDDIVARFGGEEFAVILKDISLENSIKMFESICKEVSEKKIYIEDDKSINITVSIGITNKKEESLQKMLKVADERLYIAKNSGKNKVVYEDVAETVEL